ncbi:unnamed protein product [Thlaspi arvense]|uniref:Protein kinase domain-containing protein n=1 Tax=Thlaspi arvense TaxID=13288 RepID=A0AAU9RSA6_THLAR|nr:unnamed protein product [Thlaspi arvense]
MEVIFDINDATGKSKEALSFAMRLRIAIGSARGILYLHTEANPPIFHRDIKASNILLDSRFTAKVADFGLSRLAPVPDIEGTLPGHGYLDPEYFLTHKLTDKSDVYSLGVVFLELLTGMHPISHGKNIVRDADPFTHLIPIPHHLRATYWFLVKVAHRSGMVFTIIDEEWDLTLLNVWKFVNLALKCCQEETDAGLQWQTSSGA